MTVKRFTLKGLVEGVPNICDNGEIMEQEEIVMLLNKLHEEKIKEKKMTQKRFLYDLHNVCFRKDGKEISIQEVISLLNENEDLKSFNKELERENKKLKKLLLIKRIKENVKVEK